MTRTVYRYDSETGQMYEAAKQEPGERVHIINDKFGNGDYLLHPAFEEDRYFHSKSEFQKATEAMGYVCKGHERAKVQRSRANIDVKAKVQQILNDYKYHPNKWK